MNILFKVLTLLGALVAVALFPTGVKVAKQNSERVVEKRTVPSQPVEVVEIKNSKAKFSKQGKIEDDDKWMEGLTIAVKNNSNKPVAYIEAELEFPPAEAGVEAQDSPLSFNLYFGTREKPDGQTQRLSVRPGEVAHLSLSAERYDLLKRALQD